MTGDRPRPRPCTSCPYRRDVPSGIWDASEYAKLPAFDGDIPDQLAAGATAPFYCHQADGYLCAGWAGCHDMTRSLAARLGVAAGRLDPAVIGYHTDVPLFGSGAEAAAHGVRDLARPGPAAREAMARLAELRDRNTRRRNPGGGQR